MKISIITAVFNRASCIEYAVNSVQSQTYPDVEYIVIDGASTDGTLEVLQKYLSNNATLVSEPDKGIYDALNKGLNIANGEVIGIMHSDDFFTSNSVLQEVNLLFESNHNLDVVMGGVDFVEPSDLQHPVRKISSTGFYPWMLRFGMMPPHPAIFVRKSAYDRLVGYKINYQIAGDFEFMVRLLLLDKAKYKSIDRCWVRMRIGGLSTSGWKSKRIITQEMLYALRANGVFSSTLLLLLRLPIKFLKQILL